MSADQSLQSNSLPSDQVMMEAPDSPPETFNNSFDGNSNSQAAGGNRASSESSKVNHGAPGSSWNTKKFREEYDRVYNGLLDQNWDHTKYGDPLLRN